MGLSQEKVGTLFRRCETAEESEEVVMAYLFSKWTNGGNQHQVLRKLHLLTLYLRAINLGTKLREHYQAFAIAASLTKANTSPIIILPTTSIGLEAWNAARRPSQSVFKRAFSASRVDVVSGGIGTGSSENSDAEMDPPSAGTTPASRRRTPGMGGARISVESLNPGGSGGGLSGLFGGRNRSRSNTVVGPLTAVVVASGTQEAEQTRRNAGTGNGLGTGLLSAPPNYDGRDLASYIDSDPSLLTASRAPRSEHELLPGYA